uniref:Uncharacterized protein n=2 Tax=Haptolina brevifila TaxID=156173 RepID=A0A7S2D0G7_9EUKA
MNPPALDSVTAAGVNLPEVTNGTDDTSGAYHERADTLSELLMDVNHTDTGTSPPDPLFGFPQLGDMLLPLPSQPPPMQQGPPVASRNGDGSLPRGGRKQTRRACGQPRAGHKCTNKAVVQHPGTHVGAQDGDTLVNPQGTLEAALASVLGEFMDESSLREVDSAYPSCRKKLVFIDPRTLELDLSKFETDALKLHLLPAAKDDEILKGYKSVCDVNLPNLRRGAHLHHLIHVQKDSYSLVFTQRGRAIGGTTFRLVHFGERLVLEPEVMAVAQETRVCGYGHGTRLVNGLKAVLWRCAEEHSGTPILFTQSDSGDTAIDFWERQGLSACDDARAILEELQQATTSSSKYHVHDGATPMMLKVDASNLHCDPYPSPRAQYMPPLDPGQFEVKGGNVYLTRRDASFEGRDAVLDDAESVAFSERVDTVSPEELASSRAVWKAMAQSPIELVLDGKVLYKDAWTDAAKLNLCPDESGQRCFALFNEDYVFLQMKDLVFQRADILWHTLSEEDAKEMYESYEYGDNHAEFRVEVADGEGGLVYFTNVLAFFFKDPESPLAPIGLRLGWDRGGRDEYLQRRRVQCVDPETAIVKGLSQLPSLKEQAAHENNKPHGAFATEDMPLSSGRRYFPMKPELYTESEEEMEAWLKEGKDKGENRYVTTVDIASDDQPIVDLDPDGKGGEWTTVGQLKAKGELVDIPKTVYLGATTDSCKTQLFNDGYKEPGMNKEQYMAARMRGGKHHVDPTTSLTRDTTGWVLGQGWTQIKDIDKAEESLGYYGEGYWPFDEPQSDASREGEQAQPLHQSDQPPDGVAGDCRDAMQAEPLTVMEVRGGAATAAVGEVPRPHDVQSSAEVPALAEAQTAAQAQREVSRPRAFASTDGLPSFVRHTFTCDDMKAALADIEQACSSLHSEEPQSTTVKLGAIVVWEAHRKSQGRDSHYIKGSHGFDPYDCLEGVISMPDEFHVILTPRFACHSILMVRNLYDVLRRLSRSLRAAVKEHECSTPDRFLKSTRLLGVPEIPELGRVIQQTLGSLHYDYEHESQIDDARRIECGNKIAQALELILLRSWMLPSAKWPTARRKVRELFEKVLVPLDTMRLKGRGGKRGSEEAPLDFLTDSDDSDEDEEGGGTGEEDGDSGSGADDGDVPMEDAESQHGAVSPTGEPGGEAGPSSEKIDGTGPGEGGIEQGGGGEGGEGATSLGSPDGLPDAAPMDVAESHHGAGITAEECSDKADQLLPLTASAAVEMQSHLGLKPLEASAFDPSVDSKQGGGGGVAAGPAGECSGAQSRAAVPWPLAADSDEPLPLRFFPLATLPFKHSLKVLAGWDAPSKRGGRGGPEDAKPAVHLGTVISFDYALVAKFFNRILPNSTVTAKELSAYSMLAVTCESVTRDLPVVAAVAYRCHGSVVYLHRLCTDDLRADRRDYGAFADDGRWEGRGIGQLMMHAITQMHGPGVEFECFADDEAKDATGRTKRDWYIEVCGFEEVEALSCGLLPPLGCKPLHWPAKGDEHSRRVYAMYKEADRLPETNGQLSLNLRPGASRAIDALLRVKPGDCVFWVGCSTAPEVISAALRFPKTRFVAVDTNRHAITVAERKVAELRAGDSPLLNLEVRVGDVMNEPRGQYTHVYSTAVAGPALYEKLRSLAAGRTLCMLKDMWQGEVGEGFAERRVWLSGSGEQRRLMARLMPDGGSDSEGGDDGGGGDGSDGKAGDGMDTEPDEGDAGSGKAGGGHGGSLSGKASSEGSDGKVAASAADRPSRDETRMQEAQVEVARKLETVISESEHGCRVLHLNEVLDGCNSKVRSEMVSHAPLMEAALAYLAEHHCGAVELLHARGSMKEGAVNAAKASDAVVTSLCALIEGGALWGLNAGEWSFTPEQWEAIYAAAESGTSKLCFVFFERVHIRAERLQALHREVLLPRMRATAVASWLYGEDERWNAVIAAEDKMLTPNPSALFRNKRFKVEVETSPSRQMMDTGFVTLKGVVSESLDEVDIANLDEMPMSKWRSIADTANADGGNPTRSELRQMMSLDKAPTKGLAKKLGAVVKSVLERLRSEGMLGPDDEPTHAVEDGEVQLLRAKRGCKWQSYVHGDRALEHVMQAGGFDRMHYSVMVSLMSDTALWVKPVGSQRLIEEPILTYDALCWRGDIGHGGTAHPGCDGGHYRLFMHVDAKRRTITPEDRRSLFPIAHTA